MDFGYQIVRPGCSGSDSRAESLLSSSWISFKSHVQSRQTQVIDKQLIVEHVEGYVWCKGWKTKLSSCDNRCFAAKSMGPDKTWSVREHCERIGMTCRLLTGVASEQ